MLHQRHENSDAGSILQDLLHVHSSTRGQCLLRSDPADQPRCHGLQISLHDQLGPRACLQQFISVTLRVQGMLMPIPLYEVYSRQLPV